MGRKSSTNVVNLEHNGVNFFLKFIIFIMLVVSKKIHSVLSHITDYEKNEVIFLKNVAV